MAIVFRLVSLPAAGAWFLRKYDLSRLENVVWTLTVVRMLCFV